VIAHIYRYGDPEGMTVETRRVTELEDGGKFGHANERILVLGTRPRLQVIPMSEIESFWVEEN
jgi:hypothetical protein